MANQDNESKLSKISEQYLNCTIVMNSSRYLPNAPYEIGHPNTISDGDDKGRDPDGGSGSIGTSKDIYERTCMLAKNSDRYTSAKPYGVGNC